MSGLVAAARGLDPAPIADLAWELVQVWAPPGSETPVAERMAAALAEAGARVRLDEEFPGSPSVIAELVAPSGRPGPTLQWHGHLDAIDVRQARTERTPDRIVGRGASDMRGPLASMVAAIRLLVAHGEPATGRLLITLHGRHESGGNEPLHALIARGIHGDAVVTAELGGGVELPIGALGLTFWEIGIERTGDALHENVVVPGTVDPIEVAVAIHGRLARRRADLAASPGTEPRPSLFIGQLAAGDYFNRLPNRAVLRGNARHGTDRRLADVRTELEALVAEVPVPAGARVTLDVTPIGEAYALAADDPLVRSGLAGHRALTGQDLPLRRTRMVSNAVHFVEEAGIPAIGYGPDPATNHADEEWIAVAELTRVAGGLALISADYLAGR